jgi:hypothetical protein
MTTQQFMTGYEQKINSSRTMRNPLEDHPDMVVQLIKMQEGYAETEEGEFKQEMEGQIMTLFYEIERLTGTDPSFA